jgi:HEAT repeat protein
MSEHMISRTEVTQRIGTVASGTVIGVYYASSDAKPPSEECLIHYLEQLAAGTSAPEDASEEIRRLWDQPFSAQGAESASVDLYATVRDRFAQDKQMVRIQRVMILADAGMGKTPALKYLRTLRARNSLRNYRSYLTRKKSSESTTLNRDVFVIPIFLRLADLRAGLPVIALIRDAINARIAPEANLDGISAEQVPRLLMEYRCLFLLDDLDVLLSEHHRGGIQVISQFVESHPHHQFVISCRKAGYRGQLGAVERLYLADLTPEQVQGVLTKRAYEALNPFLRQLVRNRAMLNDLLELQQEGGSAALVASRGQLLQRRIRQRLGMDRVKKPQDQAYLEMVEGVLERLAYSMQCDHTYAYDERQIMEVIRQYLQDWHEPHAWREVAAYLSHEGVLQRDDMRCWRFSDRDAAAYFAAAAIIQEPAKLEPVLDEVTDYWWRDMLQILIGLLSDPTDLLFELIDRDALVAANCIQFVGTTVDSRVVDALVDALIERMSQESSTRRAYIVERIEESGHPRAAEALLLALHREWSSMVIMAILEALRGWDQEHPELPIAGEEKKILHAAPEEAGAIADLLRMCDEDPPGDGQAELMRKMDDGGLHPRIRGLAAICLGFLGTDVARKALLDVLQDRQPDDFVAWCAVESLTRSEHQDVLDEVLCLCQEKAGETDRWARSRARAFYLLGWVGRGRDVGANLRRALQDPSPLVRGYVIDAMKRLDLRDAREQIEGLMETETEAWVLRKAAEALGQIGTVESLAVLERHLHHERARTRWMVCKAIAEIRERHRL